MAPSPDPIDVRLNWPMASVIIVLMLTVAAVVVTLVLTGHLSDSALWALGAWIAGMVKGALIPAVFYQRRGAGIRFKMGDSPTPPAP
jgi:hypothetical protein